jgi:hypothetical protein
VSVVMQSGDSTSSLLSNSSTFPVAPVGSDNCSDPVLYPGGNPPSGEGMYTFGNLSISQTTNLGAAPADRPAAHASQTPELDLVGAIFADGDAADFFIYLYLTGFDFDYLDFPLSNNICSVTVRSSATTPFPHLTGLAAGTGTYAGPSGTGTLTPGSMPGNSSTQFTSETSITGPFTLIFPGGSAVGAVMATLNVPVQPPAPTGTVINLKEGYTYNTSWGPGPQQLTGITISSTGSGSSTRAVSATCYFAQSGTADLRGQQTLSAQASSSATVSIAPQALLALPPGPGTLTVNYIVPGTFSATGIDYGFTWASNAISVPVTLQ